MSNWTQPVCVNCWNIDHPETPAKYGREIGPIERCCKCGDTTRSGIYIRIHPDTVPYPTMTNPSYDKPS